MNFVKICPKCGEEFLSSYKEKKYCSKECRYKAHSEIIKKQLSEYTPEMFKERYEKAQRTCMEKYGRNTTVNPKKLSETYLSKPQEYWDARNKKTKETCLKKYGDPYFRNFEKAKETKLKKYGDENFNNPEKNKETNKKNHGGKYSANSEKANETKKEKYGSLSTLAKRAFKTIEERTGRKHPSHLHITHYEDYNLEFIEKNFVFEGSADYKGFSEYFNIKNPYTWLRKNFKLKLNGVKNFKENLFLDFIGNCEKQKKFFSYYVDGYKDSIVYEFLGDYWHGNILIYSPVDAPHFGSHTFGDLYIKTFERFKDILEHPDIKEIKFIWESDFDKGLKENNIEKYILTFKKEEANES